MNVHTGGCRSSAYPPRPFVGWLEIKGMILDVVSRKSRSGRPALRMTVDHGGRCYTVYAPLERAANVAPGELIKVGGPFRQTGRQSGTAIEVAANSLERLDLDAITRAVSMLPASLCPNHALPSLVLLGALEDRLPDDLRGFLRRVLLDPRVSIPLLSCRASVKHHHACNGGLLVHSTQLLPVIPALCENLLPDDPDAWAFASLGYLFHDLGKLLTIGSTDFPAPLRNLRHESEGLWLMAPHLQWLESRDPASSAVLRYIFDFVATPAAERKQAKYLVADIVVMLDRLSAAADNRRSKHDFMAGWMGRPAANDERYQQGRGPTAARVVNGQG